VREEVEAVFKAGPKVERVYFPDRSAQVTDRPVVTLIVWRPDEALQNGAAAGAAIDQMTREAGTGSRTYKSALVWAVPGDSRTLYEHGRRVLAWETIQREAEALHLTEAQQRQLPESLGKAHKDLRESVWRGYNHVILLGKDNLIRDLDLGLIHSSAAGSIVELILARLQQEDLLSDQVGAGFLIRNWSGAYEAWSTKGVRDAFFASPRFPRVLRPDAVRETIARGVTAGLLAYAGAKAADGAYQPFIYKTAMAGADVEIADDVYILRAEAAEAWWDTRRAPVPEVKLPDSSLPAPMGPEGLRIREAGPDTMEVLQLTEGVGDEDPKPSSAVGTTRLRWEGPIPAQKWTTFYTRILSKLASGGTLGLTLLVDASAPNGVPEHKVAEIRAALHEMGLNEQVRLG